MAKIFKHAFLLVLLLVSFTKADLQRPRSAARIQSRLRFSARQEAAIPEANTPAPTFAPYPAAGFTPAVPFDLPTETKAPTTQLDSTYLPPTTAEGQTPEPETTYGPPPTSADVVFEDESADLISQNLLVQPRLKLSSRLRVASPTGRRARIVEVIRSEPTFVYTLD